MSKSVMDECVESCWSKKQGSLSLCHEEPAETLHMAYILKQLTTWFCLLHLLLVSLMHLPLAAAWFFLKWKGKAVQTKAADMAWHDDQARFLILMLE